MDTLRWQAPIAYRRHGAVAPYVFAAIILIGAVLIAIFQQDVITTILFALIGIMLIVHTYRALPQIEVELSPRGIKAGEKSYRYDDIASFWIDYRPEHDVKEISLHLKRWTVPLAKIQLEDEDPVQVHRILIEFIPEAKHPTTLVHTLVRWLGL